MTLDDLENFLIDNSGVTIRAFVNLRLNFFRNQSLPIKSLFFKPYKSKSDPLYRAASIITDPIYFSLSAIHDILFSVCVFGNCLVDLRSSDTKKAEQSLLMSAQLLFSSIVSLLVAIPSAIINAVDLIGGGITSLFEETTEHEQQAHKLA